MLRLMQCKTSCQNQLLYPKDHSLTLALLTNEFVHPVPHGETVINPIFLSALPKMLMSTISTWISEQKTWPVQIFSIPRLCSKGFSSICARLQSFRCCGTVPAVVYVWRSGWVVRGWCTSQPTSQEPYSLSLLKYLYSPHSLC